MTWYLKAFSQELPSGRPQIDMAPFHWGGGGGGLKAFPPLAAILGEVENWKQCVGIGLWRGWGVGGGWELFCNDKSGLI